MINKFTLLFIMVCISGYTFATTPEELLTAVDQNSSLVTDIRYDMVTTRTVNTRTTTVTSRYYYKSPNRTRTENSDGSGLMMVKQDTKIRIKDLKSGGVREIPTAANISNGSNYVSYLSMYDITTTAVTDSVYTLQCLPKNVDPNISKIVMIVDNSKNMINEITKYDNDNNIIYHLVNGDPQLINSIWCVLSCVTEENIIIRKPNNQLPEINSMRTELHYSNVYINAGVDENLFTF